MNEFAIASKSNQLVDLCINYHKKGMLGKENIIDFFNQLNMKIKNSDYYKILSRFCKILAQRGYEITFNTNSFNIIDYNSDEYIDYWEKLSNTQLYNYKELQQEAQKYAKHIINLYHRKRNFKNKCYNEYQSYVISNEKYSKKEKFIIEVGITKYITREHYDILETNPLILKKF